jgi:uncharacterized membrane protein
MLKLVQTTVIGGLIFLLPLGLLIFLLGKILSTARTMVEPLSRQLPVQSVAGISATILLTIIAMVLVSFIAGIFARTRPAQQLVQQLETHLLGRVPAYGLLKSLSNDLVAPNQEADHPVVLIQFDEAWQLGIKIGDVASGTHTVVFLPDAPTPQSGTVQIVESHRVKPTDIPLTKAFAALSARGMGLAELIPSGPRS